MTLKHLILRFLPYSDFVAVRGIYMYIVFIIINDEQSSDKVNSNSLKT